MISLLMLTTIEEEERSVLIMEEEDTDEDMEKMVKQRMESNTLRVDPLLMNLPNSFKKVCEGVQRTWRGWRISVSNDLIAVE